MAQNSSSAQDGKLRPTFRQVLRERLETLKDVRERRERGEVVHLSIPTGLRDWDAVGGIERGCLTVIGAATGDGKSIVALHLACAAAKAGFKVLLLSLEDPPGKTADRALSRETGLNNRDIGKVQVDEWEYLQMLAAYEECTWADNIHVEMGLRGAGDVVPLIEGGGYDLYIVDYVQALSEIKGETMESTIRKVALAANAVAQQTNAAVVFMSQVKGEIDKRGRDRYDNSLRFKPNDPPDVSGYCPSGLTDVAWAKALADSCKCLLYIWRPNRMLKKLMPAAKCKDNRLHIIAGKANFAEEKDLVFEFDGPTATIRDLKE